MTKTVQNNDNNWKPVTLKGAILSKGIENLIGIEELTDYNLEKNNKKGKTTITTVKSTEKKKACTPLTYI